MAQKYVSFAKDLETMKRGPGILVGNFSALYINIYNSVGWFSIRIMGMMYNDSTQDRTIQGTVEASSTNNVGTLISEITDNGVYQFPIAGFDEVIFAFDELDGMISAEGLFI